MFSPLPADYHIHTHHSGDSNAPMNEVIEASIERGLDEICFTDHLDLDYPEEYDDLPPEPFNLDIEAYREEYLKYKEKYQDKISVKFGIEIGMQPQVAQENSRIVKENDFDFVIASIHLVDRKDPFYKGFWDHASVENTFNRYFDIMLENLKLFTDYDVLGHLDYLARYVPEGDTTYSYSTFKEKIDAVLEHIIANDKGLDFNSKVLSYGMPFPNPHPDVLGRYRELGGKIITFGSDAHSPKKVASNFEVLKEMALAAGFTEYFTFNKRIPSAHKL